MTIELTPHGQEMVDQYLEKAKANYAKAKSDAQKSAQALLRAYEAKHCDHDLVPAGEFLRMVTKCTKCNFVWFD